MNLKTEILAQTNLQNTGLDSLLDDVLFFLFVAGRQAQLLLSLIVHHLLHQPPGLAVQIAQLRRLGVDLPGADFRIGHH
jgi:hypothetical protein